MRIALHRISLRRAARSVLMLLASAALLFQASCSDEVTTNPKQVIVLGFDGMDPKLCEQMMLEGRLPTLAKLRDTGGFRPLGTSTPPQSPVAWSSLITGTNPGQHGIFDFIHRDPATYMPYESTAKSEEGAWPLKLGKYKFYLKGGEVLNLRKGRPFWDYLCEESIPADVYRMPANYPPQPVEGPGRFRTLSDMGTPDMRGTVGEFTYITDQQKGTYPDITSGGKALQIGFVDNVAKTIINGPPDGLLDPEALDDPHDPPLTGAELTIERDPDEPNARFKWQDQDVLLSEGEWSNWVPVDFGMGPGVGETRMTTITGICRLYLRQVRPNFELYITPINIDPEAPALPISQPPEFAEEVAEAIGRHFTQGLPEDTKALIYNVLDRDEFLDQADLIYHERLALLDFALNHYGGGLLFFYFGSTDQVGHMYWGARTPNHPALTEDQREKYKGVVEKIYERMDKVVAQVMQRYPDATIMLLSDHGFETFTRQFNLNTWLLDNGYAAMRDPNNRGAPMNFDFSRTRAYAVGINGLYLNLRGRERNGTVTRTEKQALIDEISLKLLQYKDPQSGKLVVKEVYQADQIFSGPQLEIGPDLLIGYDRTFRASWDTALGSFSQEVMSDNTDAWCADHCIATDLVPGVLFANKPILLEDPNLEDIAPTLLSLFGVQRPEQMTGRDVFAPSGSMAANR